MASIPSRCRLPSRQPRMYSGVKFRTPVSMLLPPLVHTRICSRSGRSLRKRPITRSLCPAP